MTICRSEDEDRKLVNEDGSRLYLCWLFIREIPFSIAFGSHETLPIAEVVLMLLISLFVH